MVIEGNKMTIQTHFIDTTTNLKSALMELASSGVVVTAYKGTANGVTIQIEPTELYQDGQVIHNCRLVFKKD